MAIVNNRRFLYTEIPTKFGGYSHPYRPYMDPVALSGTLYAELVASMNYLNFRYPDDLLAVRCNISIPGIRTL